MAADKEWTDKEKLLARIISWGIIISVVIMIFGAIWTVADLIISLSQPSSTWAWFTGLEIAYQILIIGGLLVGALIGIIIFSIFIRKGQRFILDLLFKIEN